MNLFTIHNVAASGGSICSQFIAASSNSLLLSEINPLGSTMYTAEQASNRKHIFKPGRPLDHALIDSGQDLSPSLKLKFFYSQLEIALLHSQSIGKNIVLREHTHSAYPFCGEIGRIPLLEYLSFVSNSLPFTTIFRQWRPILTIRHPLDSYISASKKGWASNYAPDGLFETYCKELLEMQSYFVNRWNALMLRYEDLCSNKKSFLRQLSTGLDCSFLELPNDSKMASISVTGTSGRPQSERIAERSRQIHLVDEGLRFQVESSKHYELLCSANQYNPKIDQNPAFSLKNLISPDLNS